MDNNENKNKDKNDIYLELNKTQKEKIKNYKNIIDDLNKSLNYSEEAIFERLFKLNNNFNKNSSINIIIYSLQKKKDSIDNEKSDDLDVDKVTFNSEILFLLEKFKIIEKIHKTENDLQLFLDSVIIS